MYIDVKYFSFFCNRVVLFPLVLQVLQLARDKHQGQLPVVVVVVVGEGRGRDQLLSVMEGVALELLMKLSLRNHTLMYHN